MAKKLLVPLKGRIIVIEDDPIKEVSGIVIPDGIKEKFKKGTVHSVAKDSVLTPGDRILFGGSMNTEINIDETKYLVMKESDVVATIT